MIDTSAFKVEIATVATVRRWGNDQHILVKDYIDAMSKFGWAARPSEYLHWSIQERVFDAFRKTFPKHPQFITVVETVVPAVSSQPKKPYQQKGKKK